ncbi:hypothetical protein DP23_4376 [Ralstonia pickettii]|nr:hypothetical protein DP23_4376 [Ralstonia pickettii]
MTSYSINRCACDAPACRVHIQPAKLPPAAATTAAETAISHVTTRKKLKFLPLSSFAYTGGPRQGGPWPCRLGSNVGIADLVVCPPTLPGGWLLT